MLVLVLGFVCHGENKHVRLTSCFCFVLLCLQGGRGVVVTGELAGNGRHRKRKGKGKKNAKLLLKSTNSTTYLHACQPRLMDGQREACTVQRDRERPFLDRERERERNHE